MEKEKEKQTIPEKQEDWMKKTEEVIRTYYGVSEEEMNRRKQDKELNRLKRLSLERIQKEGLSSILEDIYTDTYPF